MTFYSARTLNSIELVSSIYGSQLNFTLFKAFASLKLVSAIFYQLFVFSPNNSPLKTVKCFLFHLNFIFVLKILKFLYFFSFLSTVSRFKRANRTGIIHNVIN